MSTPTTSTGPTPPGPTSNPVTLRGWFKAIGDWIAGLSPASATVYDTGWQNLALSNSSWTVNQQPQYRRIGQVMYMRGIVQCVTTSNLEIVSLPSALRPTGQNPVIPVASNNVTDPLRVTLNQGGPVVLGGSIAVGQFVYLNAITFPLG